MNSATTYPRGTRQRGTRQPRQLTRSERPYSPSQHGTVTSLNAERDIPAGGRGATEKTYLTHLAGVLAGHADYQPGADEFVSLADASALIGWLLTLDRKPGFEPMAEGIYRRGTGRDAVLFLVRLNGAGTHAYAMELAKRAGRWGKTYRADVTDLTPGEKLSAADAAPVLAELMFRR